MISIVVCSVKESVFKEFSANVQESIGVPYELIKIDNSKRRYNLCEAYNIGKASCKYDMICFSHEDVFFETKNWGAVLIDLFKNPEIGLVGVQGACYLSLFPDDWIDPKECEGQFIEGLHPEKPLRVFSRFPGNPAEVVAVDGVFMATRKTIMEKIRFSEDILTDFHGYDFDISMQIRRTHKVVVSRDILLIHSSNGGMNEKYFEAVRILKKKWKTELPVYIPAYKKQEINDLKIKALVLYCNKTSSVKGLLGNHLVGLRHAVEYGVFWRWLKCIKRRYLSW